MALGLGGGGGTVGTGYVKIKPDAQGFGDDLEREVGNEANARSGDMGRKASMAFRGAFLAGAATIGKSLFDFAGFDAGMREVFTLMPSITQPAMDDMTAQVKAFAGEFGVLPDEVIPSLYNSISAGVPPDNVFEFLETAQKLAKGGATDLATAVDGLSSVVNAYGSDTITATEASDALFTAVKLGKTTVDEMSASLFQVAPIASSFGVSFNEVSASIATITAQGTPTAVAATQIKSAIAELGKEGTKASDVFAELSGQSFAQFTAGGGTMTEALTMMNLAAQENGSSLVDMFGSIEAGQAALGLVKDLDKTNANLLALSDSAGATEVAFEVMNEGLAATMGRLKARFSVLMLDLGESLAPTFEALGETVAGVLEIFMALPAPMRTMIVVGGTLLAGLAAFAGPILKAIKLFQMMGGVMTVLAANPFILAAIVLAGIAYLVITNWEEVSAFFVEFGETISEVWDDVYEATAGFATDVFDAVVGTFDEIGAFFSQWWPFLLGVFAGPIGLIVGLVIQNWDLILSKTREIFGAVVGAITTAWQTAYSTTMSVGGQIIGWITGIPGKITGAFSGLAGMISAPFTAAFGAIKSAWNSTVGGFGFTVPGWIPAVGGKSFNIPSMATGGVAFDPMLAMIGDAGSGDPEVVSPVSLMRQTVAEAIDSSSGATAGPTIQIVMNVDAGVTDPQFFEDRATELARVVVRELDRDRLSAGDSRGALVPA